MQNPDPIALERIIALLLRPAADPARESVASTIVGDRAAFAHLLRLEMSPAWTPSQVAAFWVQVGAALYACGDRSMLPEYLHPLLRQFDRIDNGPPVQ